MPELIVKYLSNNTIEVLKDLAKYFEFSLVMHIKTPNSTVRKTNGVTSVQGGKKCIRLP